MLKWSKPNYRDYYQCKIMPQVLDGMSRKVLVYDEQTDKKIILKFGKEKSEGVIKDYISEYIGSKIAKVLGYKCQEVSLGYFGKNECVAIEFFNSIPTCYKELGYSSCDGDVLNSHDVRYNLDWLLSLRMKPNKFNITQEVYDAWVIDVFLLDLFLGNYDRHEGNWGFVTVDDKKELAPLYDFGSSLFIKDIDKDIQLSGQELKNEIYNSIRSSMIYNGKKRGYFYIIDNLLDTHQRLFLYRLTEFLHKVESQKDIIDKVLQDVVLYNCEYKKYIDMLRESFIIKINLLRGVVR